MKECSVSPNKMQEIDRQIAKNVKEIRQKKGIT